MPNLLNVYLVTGGTGLVGSYVEKLLLQNQIPFQTLTRKPSSPHHVYGDLTDFTSLLDLFSSHQFKGIIHMGGLVSFNEWDKKSLFQINVEGTKNLINLALEYHVKRFIMVSSSAVLGRHQTQNISENQHWTPHPSNTYYAWTKYLATKEAWRGHEEGLNVTIFYPTVILGYHPQFRSSTSLFHIAQQNRLWAPKGQNGFVSANDVAKAILIALHNEATFGEDFILNEGNYSWKFIFQTIRQAFGIPKEVTPIPPYYHSIALLHKYLSRLLKRNFSLPPYELYLTSNLSLSYDSSKWQKTINFAFEPIPKVISNIVKAYVSNQNLHQR